MIQMCLCKWFQVAVVLLVTFIGVLSPIVLSPMLWEHADVNPLPGAWFISKAMAIFVPIILYASLVRTWQLHIAMLRESCEIHGERASHG